MRLLISGLLQLSAFSPINVTMAMTNHASNDPNSQVRIFAHTDRISKIGIAAAIKFNGPTSSNVTTT